MLWHAPLQRMVKGLYLLLFYYLNMRRLVVSVYFNHRGTVPGSFLGLKGDRFGSTQLHHWLRRPHSFFLYFFLIYYIKCISNLSLRTMNAVRELISSMLLCSRRLLGNLLLFLLFGASKQINLKLLFLFISILWAIE